MRESRLTQYARRMRRDQTEPEQRLWLQLRAKRFGDTKFRRQKVVGPYIVDFAARDPMLVIEIDGDTHGVRGEYDARRTAFLMENGYRVMRFTNEEVMTNLDGVLQTIANAILPAPLPTLSPEGARAS
jgi:very-short-patch-repair endonuclease